MSNGGAANGKRRRWARASRAAAERRQREWGRPAQGQLNFPNPEMKKKAAHLHHLPPNLVQQHLLAAAREGKGPGSVSLDGVARGTGCRRPRHWARGGRHPPQARRSRRQAAWRRARRPPRASTQALPTSRPPRRTHSRPLPAGLAGSAACCKRCRRRRRVEKAGESVPIGDNLVVRWPLRAHASSRLTGLCLQQGRTRLLVPFDDA